MKSRALFHLRLVSGGLLLMMFVAVSAQNTPFPQIEPYRMASDDSVPVLDGNLDDAVWGQAAIINDFHQIRPTDRGPVSENTEVRIAYDANNFYVGVKLFDSDPGAITAKGLIQGQTFFSDDRFEFRLDTFNDRRNSYFFQVNPNGVRREALVGNDYWIEEWNTVWFARAAVHDWGWAAEMAVPFKSISFDPNTDTWGINFSRVLPRRGEETPWSSQERQINPNVSGFATRMAGMQQGRGIELVPSVTTRAVDGPAGDDVSINPSLTAFYRFNPFLTGALTLNTDFAATEVDNRQVNLSRFSLFLPEKRDFFLQDASIFEFANLGSNGRPFFSRRIGLGSDGNPLDLNVGLKMTGRAGDWNVGALAVNQERGVIGGDENLFVGRASRNVFGESSVGFIATAGDPSSDAGNQLLGFDFNYRDSNLGDGLTLQTNLWAQQTTTDGLDGSDRAFGATIDLPNDRFSGYASVSRIEENFNPALGFVNRSGVETVETQWRYRHRLDDSYVQWLRTRVQYFRADRIDGGLQSESVFLNFFEAFTSGNDFVTFFAGNRRENLVADFDIFTDVTVPAGLYDFNRYGVYAEFGQQRPFSGSFEIVDGDFYGGTNLTLIPSVTWRPSKHFRLSLDYVSNDADLPGGKFQSRLYRTRADIAFNADWAWLNFIQGDNFSNSVSINSRLRWQPRPDREFFLVFNQSRDREGWDATNTEVALKASFNVRM